MKNKKFNASTVKKVFGAIKKYRLLLAVSILLAIITVGFTLYIPYVIGDAIDLIVSKDNVDIAGVLPLLNEIIIISVGIAILQWLMNNINNKISFNVTRDIRNQVFDKIQKLPLKYVDSHSHGEILSKIVTDVDELANGLLMGFTQFFTGIMTIIGTLVFMISINYVVAIVVVCLTPISLVIASFISKKTFSLFKVQSEARAEQTSIIDECIGNIKVVKAFSHEDEAQEDFDKANEKLSKASIKAIFFSSLVNPTTRFVNALVYASVALVGAFIVIDSSGGAVALTVGALSCFLSYANQYAKPFNEISSVVTELQNALACADRVFELIDAQEETPDASELLPCANGDVKLENVAFSYNPQKELIKDLSVDIKSGMRVAIVGPTGCGKTTLINLLMRFYDVNDGAISVDGYNIKDVTRHSLRNNYGMVLQETWLQSGTIRENVAMGKPDATLDEIIEACRASHAHSFIKRLPNGYDTFVSEEACSLSAGQKQLLCIARIMLCLPPMLILDEATSSIDTRTELKIQDAFAKLMKGRTSFIVAHRLSTIRDADLILVMKDGKVIETGNHDTLLGKKGFYYNLYNSQFELKGE